MDPNNPRIIYAAVWEAYRNFWNMSSGGPGSGLHKTERRRRHLGGPVGQTWIPRGDQGEDRRRRFPGSPAKGVGHRRGGGSRTVPVGRRRRELATGVGLPRPRQPPVLLLSHLRRPPGPRYFIHPQPQDVEVDGRRGDLHRGLDPPRRQPRPVDRPPQPEADGPGERRRRLRLPQRRRVLVDDLQPADLAVLPHQRRQPVPLPGLRHAAGQLEHQRAERHRVRRHHLAALLPGRHRGERRHRRRPEGPRHRLRRRHRQLPGGQRSAAAVRPPHPPDPPGQRVAGGCGRPRHLRPQVPLQLDLPDRLLAGTRRTSCTPRATSSSAPGTRARAGRRSART